MAYRKIHDDFWTDPDIEEFTPEQKFFYLYLITNPNVNQIGLYEFSIKRACFETGYNSDTIEKLLDIFETFGKIKKSTETREILIVKFYWHNKSNSPKVLTHVDQLLRGVKDTSLIQYIYGMHTASQEEEEEVQEEVQVQEEYAPSEIDALDVCNFLLDSIIYYDSNHRYSRNKPSLKSWVKDVDRAIRLDGRTVDQLKYIIEYVFRSNKKHSDFWATNLESGDKLRKHFDKIKLQIKQEKQNGKATLTDINRNASLGVANLQFDDAW